MFLKSSLVAVQLYSWLLCATAQPAAWMSGKWGVGLRTPAGGIALPVINNLYVPNFNVDALVQQVKSMGASWLIINLSSGASGETYISYHPVLYEINPGSTPANVSNGGRDLFGEIASALRDAGIKCIAYAASEGPALLKGGNTSAYDYNSTTNTTASVENWMTYVQTKYGSSDVATLKIAYAMEIATYYANRYGDLVDGWWFDQSNYANIPLLKSIVKTANPNTVAIFNDGVHIPLYNSQPGLEDATAGVPAQLTTTLPNSMVNYPLITSVENATGWFKGPNGELALGHVFMPFGSSWNAIGTQNVWNQSQAVEWMGRVLRAGGAWTWNLPRQNNGPTLQPDASVLNYQIANFTTSVVAAITSTTPSVTPTVVPSSVPTALPFSSPTSSPTKQPVVAPTDHSTLLPSSQPSSSPSNGPTPVPSRVEPSPSSSPSAAPSRTATAQPSGTPSNQFPSSTPTKEPSSNKPTNAPTVESSDTPSSTPTVNPTSPPSEDMSDSPTTVPSFTPSSRSDVPSSAPSLKPTSRPTHYGRTLYPTAPKKETDSPSAFPSKRETLAPTSSPSAWPTNSPSAWPTDAPSSSPTLQPTLKPTSLPSSKPTPTPTLKPTPRPTTAFPTQAPTTVVPTLQPTNRPNHRRTRSPTSSPRKTPPPSKQPTRKPTNAPTSKPTVPPTPYPTRTPTVPPTPYPTRNPTLSPTKKPTIAPTTRKPTSRPTERPIGKPPTKPNNGKNSRALRSARKAATLVIDELPLPISDESRCGETRNVCGPDMVTYCHKMGNVFMTECVSEEHLESVFGQEDYCGCCSTSDAIAHPWYCDSYY